MASIIRGYEYDIFISYRQKDNKHDGWVSEFVDNLKGELESTFKEEISVYFDINPHDGLLENYDVDASLKDKLRCLICIPVISRTYCDPKSFAWEHEFKAFIVQSANDRYGLKIKLPNGNYASRVLPVRIHDLDNADIKLFESTIGGVLRSIDFVYKETGVNRQLRAKDDDIVKNPGQILYRDQINKVALAIKEIIESMKVSVDEKGSKKEEIPVEKKEERNDVGYKRNSGDEKAKGEIFKNETGPGAKKEIRISTKKGKIIVGSILLFALIFVSITFLVNHFSKVKWARERAIPDIYSFTNEGKYSSALDLAQKAERYIPDDPELKKIWSNFSNRVTTKSEPAGARIYRRNYDNSDTSWVYLGETPLDSVRFPFSFSLIKVEKKGYQTIYDATNSVLLSTRNYILDSIGKLPEEMVHIPGIRISLENPPENAGSAEINDFLIDKYEVTNKQYKAFVESGGYRDKKYWKQPFIKSGKTLTWEEAMSLFIDKTGRNGPSTWEAGDYPKGEDNFPVGGVSWYEAAACAEFMGKSLPSYYHWRRAAGLDYRFYLPPLILAGDGVWGISFIILKSNLSGHGPAPVGSYKGMAGFGTYDMVGNVREWVWNESLPGDQRFIMGAGWSDPTYIASDDYFQPPFDRSQINGFRCVSYLMKDENLTILQKPIENPTPRDYMHETPASEQQFKIFKRIYVYDKSDLNATIEGEDQSEKYWVKQKITFDAPYGKERITAYLFLPKSFKPPYQVVVYFPGSSALYMLSSKSLVGMMNIDFLLKNGRAVLYPIYKGTYERQFEVSSSSNLDIANREHIIQWYKDMARSIDYLETRSDIDTSRIAYFGFSWGGKLGPIFTVLEERIKVSVLYVAGLRYSGPFPEVDPFNYVSRVKIPTLMLNGKYDADFQYETSQKPLYELLGTPEQNKHQFIYESGHFVPRNELIKETLDWLDKYLGPVKQ
jgi:eukaryotic-like serine/threonine-protein kinase